MKIKCDFVTNSSSCSFVMVGIKTTHKDLIKKYGEEYYEHGNLPVGLTAFHEPYMIGKLISQGSSDATGISDSVTDLEKLEKYFTEVSELLGVEKSKVKLYTGERNC